ncbi:hypothetical protein PM082_019605 [Marasmius tenuissimus]|nr:hypothetical protein PM082_019605 [Marasmius tenuissimus]
MLKTTLITLAAIISAATLIGVSAAPTSISAGTTQSTMTPISIPSSTESNANIARGCVDPLAPVCECSSGGC